MSTHSVAEAKNKLPELIDRALKGEGIVITRHGRPVAELRPIPEPERRITDEDIDWLDKHRIPARKPSIDSVTLIRELRDEDDGH
ncbi:MAG: type II toxin-antitoxin system Phd/YefM family antitoxin [Rhodomicrobium sp.]